MEWFAGKVKSVTSGFEQGPPTFSDEKLSCPNDRFHLKKKIWLWYRWMQQSSTRWTKNHHRCKWIEFKFNRKGLSQTWIFIRRPWVRVPHSGYLWSSGFPDLRAIDVRCSTIHDNTWKGMQDASIVDGFSHTKLFPILLFILILL